MSKKELRIKYDFSKRQKKYYQELLDKNPEFEGTFFVGVKTTGVFCCPTFPARKPKFINCEFFKSAKEAMLASFRACQRCQPLSHPTKFHQSLKNL
ncbi:Ada metal-binding domain-containing protein [Francisella halioticida]|uniref:Ada metal-binding domain-containing protein n=1 Tax=Francisella halioticida TaxID=549298 RepID=UPI001B807664